MELSDKGTLPDHRPRRDREIQQAFGVSPCLAKALVLDSYSSQKDLGQQQKQRKTERLAAEGSARTNSPFTPGHDTLGNGIQRTQGSKSVPGGKSSHPMTIQSKYGGPARLRTRAPIPSGRHRAVEDSRGPLTSGPFTRGSEMYVEIHSRDPSSRPSGTTSRVAEASWGVFDDPDHGTGEIELFDAQRTPADFYNGFSPHTPARNTHQRRHEGHHRSSSHQNGVSTGTHHSPHSIESDTSPDYPRNGKSRSPKRATTLREPVNTSSNGAFGAHGERSTGHSFAQDFHQHATRSSTRGSANPEKGGNSRKSQSPMKTQSDGFTVTIFRKPEDMERICDPDASDHEAEDGIEFMGHQHRKGKQRSTNGDDLMERGGEKTRWPSGPARLPWDRVAPRDITQVRHARAEDWDIREGNPKKDINTRGHAHRSLSAGKVEHRDDGGPPPRTILNIKGQASHSRSPEKAINSVSCKALASDA